MPLDLPTVAAFAIAAAAIVVSPGPDTMLILRYALGSGRAAGLAAVTGVQIGLFVHTALAVAEPIPEQAVPHLLEPLHRIDNAMAEFLVSLSRSMQRHLPPPSLEAVNAALDGYDEAMLLVWKQPHTRDMPLDAVGAASSRSPSLWNNCARTPATCATGRRN